MVERTFPDGFPVHAGAEGGKCAYCIYEAPTPEAIRRTARANGLPVDRITEVQVVDPYVYV